MLWNQSCRSSVLCLLGRIRDNMSGFELSTRSLNSLPKAWIRIPSLSQQWLTPAFVLLLMSTWPRISSCANDSWDPVHVMFVFHWSWLVGSSSACASPAPTAEQSGWQNLVDGQGDGSPVMEDWKTRGTTGFSIPIFGMNHLWLIYG